MFSTNQAFAQDGMVTCANARAPLTQAFVQITPGTGDVYFKQHMRAWICRRLSVHQKNARFEDLNVNIWRYTCYFIKTSRLKQDSNKRILNTVFG